MDENATSQVLAHLTNIAGFLREIAGDLKAINQRARSKDVRKADKRVPPPASHKGIAIQGRGGGLRPNG